LLRIVPPPHPLPVGGTPLLIVPHPPPTASSRYAVIHPFPFRGIPLSGKLLLGLVAVRFPGETKHGGNYYYNALSPLLEMACGVQLAFGVVRA